MRDPPAPTKFIVENLTSAVQEKTWSSFPDLNITVTPKYLDPAQISSLAIQMVIGRPDLQQGQDLVAIHLEFGNVSMNTTIPVADVDRKLRFLPAVTTEMLYQLRMNKAC